MSLYRVPNPSECGIVALDSDSRVIRFVEKPPPEEQFSDLAHAGVSIIDPELVRLIPEGEFCDFGRDLFPQLLEVGIPMYGWPIPAGAYLLDIGAPEKYARAQREWPTPAAQRFLEDDAG
jgi:NDP-sugar pyrophosphorylase family protein